MSITFNLCQTFYLDSSLVKGANEVSITKVDLYFRAKPPATNNKSGIEEPGVEVSILPTLNGLPVFNQIGAYRPTEPTEHGAKFAFYSGGQTARVEYDEIIATNDASAPTTFLLPSPAIVRTNMTYAIAVKYDGNENFILWTTVQGHNLVGTEKKSPGASTKFAGNLYTGITNPNPEQGLGYAYTNVSIDATTANNAALLFTSTSSLGTDVWDPKYIQTTWNEVPATDLKFRVYVGRYLHRGVPVLANTALLNSANVTTSFDRVAVLNHSDANTSVVSNNIIRLISQVENQEYIIFDRATSTKRELFYGEPLFQTAPFFPGGVATPLPLTIYPTSSSVSTTYPSRLVILANNNYTYANGSTFASVGGFRSLLNEGDIIVLTKSDDSDIELRGVFEIISNTAFLVDTPFTEIWNNAKLQIAPVGFLHSIFPAYVGGKNEDMMTLYDTTANTSVRFVSDSLKSITCTANGTGYSNSDIIKVSGYESVTNVVESNYPAYANVVTHANGTISAIYMANLGAGFINSSWLAGANVEVLKTSGGVETVNPSDGSAATFSFEIGTEIKSAFTNAIFTKCDVTNLDAVRMKPEITVNNPVGTAFTIRHRTLFYKTPDASVTNGYAYHCHTPDENVLTDTYVKIFKGHSLLHNENMIPVIPSKSNQFVIRYANGGVTNANTVGDYFSNSAIYVFDISSNSDYQTVFFDPEIVQAHYANYIINRDYSEEHTNFGEAWAKHVATKINFAQERLAEDLLVYLTAYRPVGTEIKVYARLHNSKDPEEFDDKDWTLLELIDGIGVYSSREDSNDYKEFTYNLTASPNTEFQLLGSATVYQGNSYLSGTNTQFLAKFHIISGGTAYSNGDFVYVTPTPDVAPSTGIYAIDSTSDAIGVITTDGSGVITAISVANSGQGFTSQANVPFTQMAITNSTGGSTSGSTANLYFRPGVANNDLVKIYSPLFPNTNYSVAVVEGAGSNDSVLQVKREYGDLSANLVGTVTVNTTHYQVAGSGTAFQSQFEAGDYIAVWANSSVYETRKVLTVTSDVLMNVESTSLWTISGSGLSYAEVEPDNFVNNSISVSNMRVDKLHYYHQAFNNIQNDNVCRYFSNSMIPYDGFDTFQIKVVMLSNSEIHVPKIDDIRGVAATA